VDRVVGLRGSAIRDPSRALIMNDAPSSSAALHLTPDERIAGVLIPIFALRTERDQGIGDTGSLRQFIDWAADAGFALVQLLPINETGGDNSPYNAISSMALDSTTLELTPEALEDLSAEDLQAELKSVDLAALRNGPVQYAVVKPLKLRLLERAFNQFERNCLQGPASGARGKAFARFQRAQKPWLETYTLFRALMEENGGSECWDRWPKEQSTARTAKSWIKKLPPERAKSLVRRRLFHAYAQWVAYNQWEAVKRYASERGVALMGDIPLGVSYFSADYFGQPEVFELGWSGGAPPEPYFKDDPFTQKWGQNWGIPVYNWGEMRKDNFAWWRQRIGGVHDLFHVFRIDHILGFYRIYSFPWRPERNAEFLPLSADEAAARTGGKLPQFKPRSDDTWDNRQANRREGEELLRMVLEAAGDTWLIGEDLGTVPDYVRPNLTSLGIAGFKIPIWEWDHRINGLLSGDNYDRLSLATYGTHDHEPLLALWNRWQQNRRQHHDEIHRLGEFAGIPHAERSGPFTESVHGHLLETLFRSNSWIAVCMITDLLARDERFNVPGTSANSNWSQRMHLMLETLTSDPACRELTARFRAMIEHAGRKAPPARSLPA
jgi:4-alpha-glucanotransferase